MQPLALHWLSALYIALCRLPALHIALRRLPDLIMHIVWLPSLAPNNSVLHIKGSKHSNQTGCRIATSAMAPSPTYSHTLAPYTDSLLWLHTSGSRSKHRHQKSKGFLEWFPSDVFSIFKNETSFPIFQTLYVSKRLLLRDTGKELT